ncbi:DUF488 domain-containing protein [Sphingomonas sp. LaA6.9]|uniref:DUF488 domain-containing protein n=1 Tax=Sphingomonas sp. LaA6.9 TaxID=2919914 RepID=UPI001F4FDBFF|nr:DUF488 family protein [Sphingomonas sp. LaA6.9]MCJ8157163.1 DUF488 family protein [Sphingomonas sp. LaA6.9]
MKATLRIKRIHEPVEPDDGARFLVDRLWPRGVSKEKAALTGWLRVLSPSDMLRKLYHGETGDSDAAWDAFRKAYADELEIGGPDIARALAELDAARASGPVTLLYAAKNEARNNAVALKAWIEALH